MTMRQYRVIICIVTAFILIGVWFLFSWIAFLKTPLVVNDHGYEYTIPKNASLRFVINDLYILNIIKNKHFFWLLIFLKNNQHKLESGEYLFPKGTTPGRLLFQIMHGSGMVYHTFTIVPGWSFYHLRKAMNAEKNLLHTSRNLSDAAIMKLLKHSELKPEGLFFPDTYLFVKGSSDIALLKQAFKLMQEKLNKEWATRDVSVLYKTPYEALIAASMIEKETGVDTERDVISGVLYNRLQKNMLLQIDPTVIYDIGAHYRGKLYKKDLLRNTPHNTYIHKGLPPTPIAMPGMESLHAALHPKHHHFLYFVAKGNDDSEHQFSQTFKEHEHAINVAKHHTYKPPFFNAALVRYYFLKLVLPRIYHHS